MIKVLMVGNHPSNKGGMTSVINQIKAYNWGKHNIQLNFIPTFIPGNKIIKTLYFIISYVKILFRIIVFKPDIMHMHMSYKGSFTRKYMLQRLCKMFGVKNIIHLHGSEFEKWYEEVDKKKKKKIRRLLSECDGFIVLGQKWKKVIRNIEPSTRIITISNGISIPSETVCWNENKCQVLFLGVLIPRKGVEDLIKAASMIRDSNNENIRIVIAGTGEDEEKLKRAVTEAGLNETVKFAGWISGRKKEKLMLNSQILVSPSYNEGLPISILEAASYGMPIVSTDVGDVSMVVKDGVNGILFNPGDIVALFNGLLALSTKEIFDSMSYQARSIIENNFSIDIFYNKLLKLYRYMGEK